MRKKRFFFPEMLEKFGISKTKGIYTANSGAFDCGSEPSGSIQCGKFLN